MKILLCILALIVIAVIIEYWQTVLFVLLFVAALVVGFKVIKNHIIRKKEKQAQQEAEAKEAAELAEKQRLQEQFLKSLEAIPAAEVLIDKNAESLTRLKMKNMPEIHCSIVTKRFNKDTFPSFVVFDTETTGLYPASCRIIELSAIRYEHFQPVARWSTLINPGVYIPSEASAINHITDEMVEDAPALSEVAQSFMDFIKDSPLVGYNISFDIKFLYASGIDVFTPGRKFYDAMSLAKKAFYGELVNYKLTTVAEALACPITDAHRSLSDCYATGHVFDCCIDKLAATNE